MMLNPVCDAVPSHSCMRAKGHPCAQAAELQPTPRADGNTPAAATQQPALAHCSSIVALQRSPFLDALVLSAGGWDWALWLADDLAAPLMRSPAAPVIYTAAAWSPTRPGAPH